MEQFYECGICGAYHPAGWDGDCRADAYRFAREELDERYGEDGWEEVYPDEDEEPTSPEEGDYTLDESGDVATLYSVATGRPVYDTKQGRPAIRAWLEADGYWPNVWVISDHGNAHLVTDWT